MYQSWSELLKVEMSKDYFKNIMKVLNKEYDNFRIYPPQEDIMKAFLLTPLDKVKVVIIGQDPYHEEGQAMGLSFSVHKGTPLPKSLINIYKEAKDDVGLEIPLHGDLSSWAKQGVFLLNTILTVEEGKPLSHKNMGWEKFTLKVLKTLNEDETPKVFILWGKEAIGLKKILTNKNHLILEGPHPSPLSSYRGFFGSKPFSKTNEFLKENGREEINWSI